MPNGKPGTDHGFRACVPDAISRPTNVLRQIAMECPNCLQQIPFFSRATHTSERIAICPHCALPMRKEFVIGRIVLFSFLIGAPIRLLGVFVPALSFLDNLLTTVASIWLGTILGLRFRHIEPVLDGPTVLPGEGNQSGRLAIRAASGLTVPTILGIWLLYGLLVWDGISRSYLGNLPILAWDLFGQWIPSIQRLHVIGREWPKLHASLLLTALPLLILSLIRADMSSGVSRVVASGRRSIAIVLLPLLGSIVFFIGLDSRRLGDTFFTYALGSSLLFAGSAYFLALGVQLARVRSVVRQPVTPPKNEAEIAIEALKALSSSLKLPTIAMPPTVEIRAAIRLLGRLHGIEEECLKALADLDASPPLISGDVQSIALRLLAMSSVSNTAKSRSIC